MKLHIGFAGHIATEYVTDFLASDTSKLPKGYPGAPLTGVLIGELLKQGHKVSAFTTDPSLYKNSGLVKASGPNFDFYICPARPRAWRFNKIRLGRAVDGFAYERQQLFNAINMAKPDIIHAHWTYEFALAAIETGLPHLITCHDAPAVILRYNPYLYRAIRYLMARLVFKKGQHFSAVSSYMREAVQHYTKIPIAVVPNPLADSVLAIGQPRIMPTTRRIGMICNGWDARKNPKPSLEAFAKIHSEQPSAELHLFGSGFGIGEPAQLWCQQQGLTMGMVFHGTTPHRQLIEQLNGLDLLLHPAVEESFGVVVAESMALGLPIVAGRHSGAVPWVVGIDDTNDKCCSAVLTNVTDPDAIASAVVEAFDQNYPERSASGCTRARQMFASGMITESYMALYRQILLDSTESAS
ncbi:MAG: glycosyltransferase family 4 protein [Methylococcaceae bacterium]|nr:glycosyltransferase family 4 protein [Methylococcaceae bacterium]MDZ4155015.1 glycosyltransferase family 4 protein [Methylococcales bacterium]MDP2394540.1 glycosyltransferase family 4 protein [Methylococcaceae bacterium]MDP3021584.1 glycosyltransferase family 4 protein [Methylococcaceae bacterium]MDP3392083.1 glycosyltransferase family 4 protein [Methylococcaceae bacterium]